MNRRNFLLNTAAAGITIATQPSLAARSADARPHFATNTYPWGTFAQREGGKFVMHSDAALATIASSGITGYEPSVGSPEEFDGLGAREDDWYVEKNRLSAFFQTNLELVLRSLNADTLLICGVLTNQCVAATSKDASFRDFKPIVVAEATGTTLPHLHEPALEMMRVGWAEVRSIADTERELADLPLANA